jgi:pimeloyl-ACP methyl ester carboxylesterase
MRFIVDANPAYAYTGGIEWKAGQSTIVLIHGAQNDHSVWILQSRYLAHHGFNVLAVDLPGHGRSAGPALHTIQAMAAWIGACMDATGVTQAAIAGHSMGSLIGLEIAGRHAPERCLRLAMLGTACPMTVSETLLQACEQDEPHAIGLINQWSHSGLNHWPGTPGPGFSVYVQGLRLMQRQSHGVLPIDFHACNNYQDGSKVAMQVQCPVLLLNGERDQMTTAKAANALLAQFPSTVANLRTIPDCGHALMAEHPDRVLKELKQWLGLK